MGLGAKKSRLARRISMMSIGICIAMWACVAFVLVAFRRYLAAALSRDTDVQDIIQALLLIYAGQGFFDSPQYVMGAILQGLGNVQIPSAVNLVSFYLVALP